MKSYLPGLNTIRLYAAGCVLLNHTQVFGNHAPTWLLSGPDAVTVFFALSGFIISYQLMRERSATGTIDVTAFWRRRALRIMPLYFLIVAVGYVLPMTRSPLWTLPYALTFTAAIPHSLDPTPLPWLGVLWSIGVEEAFYLFYPVLVKRFGVAHACVGIIVVRALILWIANAGGVDARGAVLLNWYRFEVMAIGGLFAWALIRRHWTLRFIMHPAVAWLSFGLLVLCNFRGVTADAPTLALLTGVLMVNVSSNPRFPTFEHPVAAWLGKRTYGIYMIHMLVIGVLFAFVPELEWTTATIITLALTFVLAAVSYRYFETPFLRLKQRRATHRVLAIGD